MSLADAMAKSPETFPRVYIAMVQAGETGGFLDVVLAQIADFQAREKELKSKVMTAMLYPCILLVLAIGGADLSADVFHSALSIDFHRLRRGAAVARRRSIVGASHVMRSYGLFVVVGSSSRVSCWCGIGSLSEKGRRVWEGLMLRAPMVGPLVAQFAMARFCRMLGTLAGRRCAAGSSA